MLTIDEIKELIQAIDQSSIRNFELEQDGTKLVIAKGAEPAGSIANWAAVPADRSQVVQNRENGKRDQIAETLKKIETGVHTIASPMVGTFYAAPEPGANPFVQVGQTVGANTVVCVLEAMKLFNEIEAGAEGTIVDILVKDGDFVEYGQPLFHVRTI